MFFVRIHQIFELWILWHHELFLILLKFIFRPLFHIILIYVQRNHIICLLLVYRWHNFAFLFLGLTGWDVKFNRGTLLEGKARRVKKRGYGWHLILRFLLLQKIVLYFGIYLFLIFLILISLILIYVIVPIRHITSLNRILFDWDHRCILLLLSSLFFDLFLFLRNPHALRLGSLIIGGAWISKVELKGLLQKVLATAEVIEFV